MKAALATLLALFCWAPSFAQGDGPPTPEWVSSDGKTLITYKFESKVMGRPMFFQVAFPPHPKRSPNYRGPEPIFPVLFLLHGLSGHYDNWSTKTKIVEYAATFRRTIVMPEGGD